MNWTSLGWVVGIVVTLALIALFLVSRYRVASETSEVLIIKRMNGKVAVAKTGGFVWPIINTSQIFSIHRRVIDVYSGSEKNSVRDSQVVKIGSGIHCKDNIRADLQVSFYLKVSQIESIAESFNYIQLTDQKAFSDFFVSKLSEALKTAAREYEFVDLMDHRDQFRKSVIEVLNEDLYGFILDDVTIRSIEQTPITELDDHNILDIQGKEKVTNITANKLANITQIEEDALTATTERQVKGQQSRLQLNKNLEEEKARTQRQVDVIKFEEQSATVESQEKERLRQEEARIKTNQGISIIQENSERDIQIAKVQNEKVVGVEQQKVKKDIRLAEIETVTQAKQKELENDVLIEEGNKNVAQVRAQRVGIEKDIVTQEQETLDIEANKTAEREKSVLLTKATAEAEAQSKKVIVGATTEKEKAALNAETVNINAEAELSRSKKEAEATIVISEARKAELAAEGLAQAEVKMKNAEADMLVGETAAENTRKLGMAEVEVTEKRYEVMNQLPETVREHEINLKNIDVNKEISIRNIEKDEVVETAKAESLAKMYSGADIRIIGDSKTLDSMQSALRTGVALDTTIDNSKLLSKTAEPYISGERNLADDLASIAKELKVSESAVLSLSLMQIMSSPTGSKILERLGLSK